MEAANKQVKDDMKRRAGIRVPLPRQPSAKTIKRDEERKKKISTLILSGDIGHQEVKNLVPLEQFEKFEKEVARRRERNLFPFNTE